MDAVAFALLLFGSCAYAGFRGGAPERIGAGLLTVAAVLSVAVNTGFRNTEWGILGIDLALFLALLGLSLHANRYWPLWVTSLQFVTLFSHLGFAALQTQAPQAYAIASVAWAFPIQIILAFGTARHRQRLTQFTVDPPWSGY
jgi:hypothetical protein